MQNTQRASSHFRVSEKGMVLIATSDPDGGRLQFPPVAFAHGNTPVEVEIGPIGRVYTWTVVHPGKDKDPYALAMVDFAPGLRVFGRLLLDDGAKPVVDASVTVVPFTLADGTSDYAFSAL